MGLNSKQRKLYFIIAFITLRNGVGKALLRYPSWQISIVLIFISLQNIDVKYFKTL